MKKESGTSSKSYTSISKSNCEGKKFLSTSDVSSLSSKDIWLLIDYFETCQDSEELRIAKVDELLRVLVSRGDGAAAYQISALALYRRYPNNTEEDRRISLEYARKAIALGDSRGLQIIQQWSKIDGPAGRASSERN